MTPTDAIIAAPVVAGAVALLIRSLRKRGGSCHGCGGCSRGQSRDRHQLVALGRPPPRDRGASA